MTLARPSSKYGLVLPNESQKGPGYISLAEPKFVHEDNIKEYQPQIKMTPDNFKALLKDISSYNFYLKEKQN